MGAANQMQNQYAASSKPSLAESSGLWMLQNQAIQQAQLGQQQNALNQQGSLAYQQLGFNAQAENLQAMESNQQAANQLNQANAKNMSSGIGGMIGAIGGAAMFSDARVKKGIHGAGPEIDAPLAKWAADIISSTMT